MNTAPPRRTRSTVSTTCSVSLAPFLLLLGVAALSACDKFNQPAQPCPEIPAAAFESALSAGDTRGEIEVSGSGLVSSQFGGGMKTCRKDKTALTGEVCGRSRDLDAGARPVLRQGARRQMAPLRWTVSPWRLHLAPVNVYWRSLNR